MYQYNAPLFDASDPEQRNNRQFTASLTYFLSDRRFGSHELKGGVEDFVDTRIGANSQTSTGYLFTTNFKVDAGGQPMLDAAGRLIPVFTPGTSRLATWLPQRGADVRHVHRCPRTCRITGSPSPQLTVNLGMRFEHAASDATAAGSTMIDFNRVVPRLGASYDALSDGKIGAPGQLRAAIQGSTTTRSSRRTRWWEIPTAMASRTPGRPAKGATLRRASILPTTPAPRIWPRSRNLNITFDPKLSSPVTDEFTLGRRRRVRDALVRQSDLRPAEDRQLR